MKRDWTCDGCGCRVNRDGNVEVQALLAERDQLRAAVVEAHAMLMASPDNDLHALNVLCAALRQAGVGR